MKTILHLSIALMAVAGAAGSFDFMKMYRSGEIDKIYVAEKHPHKHVVAHAGKEEPVVTVPTQTIEEPVIVTEKKIEKNAGAKKVITVSKTDDYIVASVNNDKTDEIITTTPIVDNNATLSDDDAIDKEDVVAKPKAKKFKLSMYSRGMIYEEEEEVVEGDSSTDE